MEFWPRAAFCACVPAWAQFETRDTFATLASPISIVTGDFNHDGKMDVAVSSAAIFAAVQVYLGKGDGTFGPAALYDTGGGMGPLADYLGYQEQVLLNTGVVAFSPTTPLNFKKQQHGTTSLPQTVTLTNTGASSLNISSMKVAGQFGMTSTCGSSVAAGANCAISVTFSPQTQGMKQGTVTIVDSASSKPQVIELGGTGT